MKLTDGSLVEVEIFYLKDIVTVLAFHFATQEPSPFSSIPEFLRNGHDFMLRS